MANNIKRVYGKEKNLGDILYNKSTKEVYTYFNLGFFGIQKIILIKNAENTYDLAKIVAKNNESSIVKLGKTFPVLNKDKVPVEGITQTTIALGTFYDKETEKNLMATNDALFITTHKLKETKVIDNNISKVGFIKGRFGIEIEEENENKTKTEAKVEKETEAKAETKVEKETKTKTETKTEIETKIDAIVEVNEIEVDEDEIPF